MEKNPHLKKLPVQFRKITETLLRPFEEDFGIKLEDTTMLDHKHGAYGQKLTITVKGDWKKYHNHFSAIVSKNYRNLTVHWFYSKKQVVIYNYYSPTKLWFTQVLGTISSISNTIKASIRKARKERLTRKQQQLLANAPKEKQALRIKHTVYPDEILTMNQRAEYILAQNNLRYGVR